MMSYFFKIVFISFLSLIAAFGAFFATAIPYICKAGVECLTLDKCTGLYRRWQQDRERYNYTVELLLCEKYNAAPNKLPKVCCAANLFLTNEPLPPIKPVTFSRTITIANEARAEDVVCGVHNVDKILGGTKTQIDEYPWMALLRYDNARSNATGFYCGGVLVSSRYILTAAHCVQRAVLQPGWNLTQAILGEWNTSSTRDCDGDLCNVATEVPIERAVVHEQYDPKDLNMLNDIALLRLTQEVKFNDFVRPICLPTETELLNNTFEGYDLHVAGWGKTELGSSSPIKLKVSLPVYEHRRCQNQYFAQGKQIIDKQLCIGGGSGQDSCKGDSGGPLMGEVSSKHDRWTVIGVVSYGPIPCGTEGWPGIYTRVAPYLSWIQANMNP